MPTLYEFSRAISTLVNQKDYQEAINHFKNNQHNFTADQISSNEYLISNMLTAFRKGGDPNRGFVFLDFYNINVDNNTSERVLTSYGWLLYSKLKLDLSDNHLFDDPVLDDEEPHSEFEHSYDNQPEITQKILDFIPIIVKFSGEYSRNVLSFIFNIFVRIEKKKLNPNWNTIIKICDLINPDILSSECTTIEVERKGIKKPMELASSQEVWYAIKSKALMKLERYEECYAVSVTALEKFTKFHYSNDVWFARRIALSKKYMGDVSQAIKELEVVLKRKREWFVLKELSELHKESGEIERSFSYAIDAINGFGGIEFKVELLYLMGELLLLKKEDELAYKHFSLSYMIRVREEWKVPEKLNYIFHKLEKNVLPVENYNTLLDELKKYWNSFSSKSNDSVRFVGKIDKILNNNDKGANGFLKYDGNKSVYFTVRNTDPIINSLNLGLEVEFEYVPPADGKKDIAIKLKILKGIN